MIVVITGASSGIGRELAARYAPKASRLYLIARREESLRELADELRNNKTIIKTFGADVTDFETLRSVCQAICDECERVDLVIANAGISSEHKAELYDFWDFKKIIDTNLLGVAAVFANAPASFVVASSISLASAQARKLVHFAVPPLPTKSV